MAHLAHLLPHLQHTDTPAVPAWMWGAFRRRSITFSHGQSDVDTRVFWLQSRGLTIDLRLPLPGEQQAHALPRAEDPQSLKDFCQYEGWYAHAHWENQQLSWRNGCSFQFHNRWPEEADLKRVGNCMIEFAPSLAYVEDWRFLPENIGPLLALELIAERPVGSKALLPRQGALIICGAYAGLVLGRQHPEVEQAGAPLPAVLAQCSDVETRRRIINFETSIAYGSLAQGFQVVHSLHQERMHAALVSLESWVCVAPSYLVQQIELQGKTWERHWRIDTAIPNAPFSLSTPASAQTQNWLAQESASLARYLQVLA